MKSINSRGPWRQIRDDLDYEMNPCGVVRSIPGHREGSNRVVYMKPCKGSQKNTRYQFYCNGSKNKRKRVSFTLTHLFKTVWGTEPEITRANIDTLKQIAERKNRENCINQKKKPGVNTNDKPLIVNGKPRYCAFCGYQLFESDLNFFYHRTCYTSRNSDMMEDCFAGGHSYQ